MVRDNMTVLYSGTNMEDNLPRYFDQFVGGHLGVVDISLSLKATLRCWIRTSNLVAEDNIPPHILR